MSIRSEKREPILFIKEKEETILWDDTIVDLSLPIEDETFTRHVKWNWDGVMEKWAMRFDQLRINEEIRNSAVFLSWHDRGRKREKKGREKEKREIRFLQLIASRTTFPGLKRCRGKIHRIESNRAVGESQWLAWYL